MRGSQPNPFVPDLPPMNFTNMGEQLLNRLSIEILRNLGIIPDEVYYTKHIDNAEVLDRDYRIWKELCEISEFENKFFRN